MHLMEVKNSKLSAILCMFLEKCELISVMIDVDDCDG
jgi:hypothetical protein